MLTKVHKFRNFDPKIRKAIQKISYASRDYESVDEKSLS